MSHSKDRIEKLLRKCLRFIKDYHKIAVGGDWPEKDQLESLIEELEKAIIYRTVGPIS